MIMSEQPEQCNHKRRRDPRYDFRAQSHAAAHAQATLPEAIPEHPLIPRGPVALIDTAAGLAELVQYLRSMGGFAYDSEFIGEMSYHPKLCLIQVGTRERVALIDPLAGLDLTEFWKLIADPAIEKVVHSGQQDLEPVFRQLNQPAAGIFDTQIAAGFIGLAYPVGLSKLVREVTGVHLGKGFTFTHWDHRPLTSVQLRYAADDVRYLPAVRKVIGEQLETSGHKPWVSEECEAICDPALYCLDPAADFMRVRGANALGPKNLAILRELVIWRDAAAQRHDMPPRTLLKDEILTELARSPVSAVAGLAKVRGLPRPVEASEGEQIIAATQKGLAVPEAQWPALTSVEESPTERFAIDSLWATVQAWCAGHRVDPGLATSRQEIARLYRDMQANGSLPSEHRLIRGWRGQLLGEILSQFLRGSTALQLQWKDGALCSTAKSVSGT
jgi:ribonuclease D